MLYSLDPIYNLGLWTEGKSVPFSGPFDPGSPHAFSSKCMAVLLPGLGILMERH